VPSPGGSRFNRKETDRFKSFTYDDLIKHDTTLREALVSMRATISWRGWEPHANLDIFWLKDESLEDSANLPDPGILAAEIAADLEAALEQFATIADELKK
jgi:type I restriction enzyme M protein